MLTSRFLYDFGISQDDPLSELRALDLQPNDRLLCIASAGEVPLELLVNSHPSIEIDAVDISTTQLYLSKLKMQAAIHLTSIEAAKFLGYMKEDKSARKTKFEQIRPFLTDSELRFWLDNPIVFEKGPIHYGRYERYMARFAAIGQWLLGGERKIHGLFECTDTEQQRLYFERELRTGLLKKLFQLMFNQRLYKNRGIPGRGLRHLGNQNPGASFFKNFRAFCTGSPARKNWYLQFMLFGRVLFEDALPSYLAPQKQSKLREESHRLHFIGKSFSDMIAESPKNYYNKFVFSNVSDWESEDEMRSMMDLVAKMAGDNTTGLLRFLYSPGISHEALPPSIKLDAERGKRLRRDDRFPFYHLWPLKVIKVHHAVES